MLNNYKQNGVGTIKDFVAQGQRFLVVSKQHLNLSFCRKTHSRCCFNKFSSECSDFTNGLMVTLL